MIQSDLPAAGPDLHFRTDVLRGLAAPRKAIPARWLYDRRGSELFEQITRIPEYYPTRIESDLLRRHGAEIHRAAAGYDILVEFGSGSSAKTGLLIESLAANVYVPIDISGEFLRSAAIQLRQLFPTLSVLPVEADFMRPIPLPDTVAARNRIGLFLGGTIGNLAPREAVDLLRAMKQTLGPEAMLLIGMDRIKPVDILLAAYDDPMGVTAEFNLNLLHRINRELEGDIPVDRFRHLALWNDDHARIEMHLRAQEPSVFSVAGQRFEIAAGETIHTENSHKYGERDQRLLLRAAGWNPIATFADPDRHFSLLLARSEAPPSAP